MLGSGDKLIVGVTLTSVRLKAPPPVKISSLAIVEALRWGVIDESVGLGKMPRLPILGCGLC